MQEKFRCALGIGAAVHDDGIAAGLIGDGRAHGGSADSLDPLDDEGSAGEQRAGGAGGDKGIALPLGQQPQADDHGGILPLVDHRTRIVVHIHHVLRTGNFHALGQIVEAVLLHNGEYFLAAAHQSDLGSKVLVCRDGAQYGGFGSQIAAHCVQDDLHISILSFTVRSPEAGQPPQAPAGRWPDSFRSFSGPGIPMGK